MGVFFILGSVALISLSSMVYDTDDVEEADTQMYKLLDAVMAILAALCCGFLFALNTLSTTYCIEVGCCPV